MVASNRTEHNWYNDSSASRNLALRRIADRLDLCQSDVKGGGSHTGMVTDLAILLGVSKQRVGQIVRKHRRRYPNLE